MFFYRSPCDPRYIFDNKLTATLQSDIKMNGKSDQEGFHTYHKRSLERNPRMNKKCGFFRLLLPVLIVFLICLISIEADADTYSVTGAIYELPDNSDYDLKDARKVLTFSYGNSRLGALTLNGIDQSSTYDNTVALGVKGDATVSYMYTNDRRRKNPDIWYVDGDGTGKVNGHGLGFLQGVGHGCIIVEKSVDKQSWEMVIDPKKDYFKELKSGQAAQLFKISENEVKNGMYYRITVAYRITRRKQKNWHGDDYEHKKCLEIYNLYISSEKNYIDVIDIGSGKVLYDSQETKSGFMIRRNGSNNKVVISRNVSDDNTLAKLNVPTFSEMQTEPGIYNVYAYTKLGKKYTWQITVTEGVDFTEVPETTIYKSKKNKGYSPDSKDATQVQNTVFLSPLTTVSLASSKAAEIKAGARANIFGIKGQELSIFMKLNRAPYALGSGWIISNDDWGKKVDGVTTGPVGKGALIIRKSRDGRNWTDVDRGKYSKGLYTTDYATYYGRDENVLIYTPSGQDIIEGVHIQIIFAYQVYNKEKKEYVDYIETHKFYLCSDDLDAVTFHNNTLNSPDALLKSLGIDSASFDANSINVYKGAETLVSGSYTTTGFTIDKKLNKAASITVARDGSNNTGGKNGVYELTGKYDIHLTDVVGSEKDLTIYVDRSTDEEAMTRYFDDHFISGKRIYSEDMYPVYEGGEINYHVSSVDTNIMPLYGKIINQTTGSEIVIEQTAEEKNGVIEEAGEYKAVFSTTSGYFTGEYVGDARVFTFQFKVIPHGAAPGPQINQKLLKEYASSTVSDSNPIYYGLTFSSAGKGNITLAFASKEAAVEYAYNYEKGTVEQQSNGTYRYNGSFFLNGQKTKYESAWSLTDAVNYFAEAAVHTEHFDLSDEFTYLSLMGETLANTPNLRKLELSRSVTIFGDHQKELLTQIDALPIINDKPYAYLDVDADEVISGTYSFQFTTDDFGGIDSRSVRIIDSEGKEYAIRYSESVYEQLLEHKCPSGVITIHEENKYGDVSEYQAVYIAPGDNQTLLTFACTKNGAVTTNTISKENADTVLTADAFGITAYNYYLDPYAIILVQSQLEEEEFLVKDAIDKIWSDPGEYHVTCVDRLGNYFTTQINIVGAGNAADNGSIERSIKTQLTELEQRRDDNVYLNAEQGKALIEGTTNSGRTSKTLVILVICIPAVLAVTIIIILINKKQKLMQYIGQHEGDEEHE